MRLQDRGGDLARPCRFRGGGSAPKNLRAAACVIPRSSNKESARFYLATLTGNLYLDENENRLHKVRSDLPTDYDFPIFSSALGTWEARYDKQGDIFFQLPY